jgi:hypothetical protein
VLRGLRYTVRVPPDLRHFDVQLCFDGAPPARLVYGTRAAAAFLRDVRALDPGARATPPAGAQQDARSDAGRARAVPPAGAPQDARRDAGPAPARALPVRDGYIELPGLAADGCIAYAIDVAAALDADALMLAYRGDDALLFASELLLWRPIQRPPALHTELRFELPPGVQVSTPWPGHPSRFQLDESAFAFTGHLLIGRFDERTVRAPGTQLKAAIMHGFPEPARALLVPWLERAALLASAPSGSFPSPNAQLIIVPTSPSPSPIHFGHTGRSGGASIVFLLPTDVDAAALEEDWIAVHEFSHLWHPFVRREDAWLSEGIATYLQEVLRARAGALPPQSAWQHLYEGARRGRDTDQTLEYESRIMRHAHNYERVYWAGAAIALMLDVALRQSSDDRQTLESVLAQLHDRDAHDLPHAYSADELLRALDREAHRALCRTLAEQKLTAPQLPDLGALYAQLGIIIDPNGAVHLTSDAPLAWIRDAITARSSDVREHRTVTGSLP